MMNNDKSLKNQVEDTSEEIQELSLEETANIQGGLFSIRPGTTGNLRVSVSRTSTVRYF